MSTAAAHFCIVVEWDDGSVGTNGPYLSMDDCVRAATKLVDKLVADYGIEPDDVETSHWHPGIRGAIQGPTWALGEEGFTVSCQAMGLPFGIEPTTKE